LLIPEISARAADLATQYPQALELLTKISQRISVDGMESLIPLLTDQFESIVARMPQGTEVIFIDEERIKSRTSDLLETNAEFLEAAWSHAALGADAPLPVVPDTYLSWNQLQREMRLLLQHNPHLIPLEAILMRMQSFLMSQQ
jgi:transcription-repair coupling factor (superfamily II helicase)